MLARIYIIICTQILPSKADIQEMIEQVRYNKKIDVKCKQVITDFMNRRRCWWPPLWKPNLSHQTICPPRRRQSSRRQYMRRWQQQQARPSTAAEPALACPLDFSSQLAQSTSIGGGVVHGWRLPFRERRRRPYYQAYRNQDQQDRRTRRLGCNGRRQSTVRAVPYKTAATETNAGNAGSFGLDIFSTICSSASKQRVSTSRVKTSTPASLFAPSSSCFFRSHCLSVRQF